MADPGFSRREGAHLVGGHQLPTWLHFVKFVCRNERIGSLRGAPGWGPLDPPMGRTGIKMFRMFVWDFRGIQFPFTIRVMAYIKVG